MGYGSTTGIGIVRAQEFGILPFFRFASSSVFVAAIRTHKGDIVRKSVRIVAVVLILAALGVASPSAQGREGIKVHGDWVIEVRNADGTLAQRHEFKNALVVAGHVALSGFLRRTSSIGRWTVFLLGDDQLNVCAAGSPISRAPCLSTEVPPVAESQEGFLFGNLQVTAPATPTGPDFAKVQLSGFVTAAFAGNIREVQTDIGHCSAEVPPSTCKTSSTIFISFTSRTLEVPISVEAGQIVQFKVVLSFS